MKSSRVGTLSLNLAFLLLSGLWASCSKYACEDLANCSESSDAQAPTGTESSETTTTTAPGVTTTPNAAETLTSPIASDTHTAVSSGSSAGTSSTSTPTSATQHAQTGTLEVSNSTDSSTGAASSACSQSDCCADGDCSSSQPCTGGACLCEAQQMKACGDGSCVDPAQCCEAADCPTGSSCNSGTCECPDEMHVCDGACVSDKSTDSCGASCTPCSAPMGGSAACDGTQCGATCPSGKELCLGECITSGTPCSGMCPSGMQNCNNFCSDVKSVAACGPSCRACVSPSNGSATCDGTNCGIACNANYKECNGACIAQSACCTKADCAGELLCNSNTCGCSAGEKRCDDQCIPTGGCCSSAECGSGLGCVNYECVDTTAPAVVSFSPANGAKGVTSSATITITFSEPMDRASVEGALTVSSLAANSRSLTWNTQSTSITIIPTTGLQYASGTSTTSTTAKAYTVTFSASARDVAGNTLAQPVSSSFTTLRRIAATLNASSAADYSTYGHAIGDDPALCPGTDNSVRVGHHSSIAASGDFHIYALFELSSLLNVTTLESAIFSAVQLAQDGTF